MTHRETKRFHHYLSEHIGLLGKIFGLVLFLVILLMPSPEGLPPNAQRLAAITLLMASLWFTQAIPIAATALIPVFAFPILEIQPSATVSIAYINKNIFLFLGGFIIALGIERWNLHKRIALHIVKTLGTSLQRIVLGFMLATGFLSMWISNTASSLLMLPIGLAILVSLEDLLPKTDGENSTSPSPLHHFSIVLMLAIAYSASIGGLSTLVGTPTNLQYVDLWEKTYPQGPEISIGKWIFAIFPMSLLFLFITWRILVFGMKTPDGLSHIKKNYFGEKIKELGRPKQAEILMFIIFASTALLWMTRTGLVINGYTILPSWQQFVPKGVDDSTVAMGMAVLMFFVPATKENKNGEKEKTVYLMDWSTSEKLPWGILLLLGGGFALAGGFKDTGLSIWLGEYFGEMTEGWPLWVIILSICLLMTFLTEFTSNVATIAALLPILVGTATKMEIDPRLLMIPATISASCAFMMPIATPPNAIVFGSGRIPMGSMIRYGFILNILGAFLITLCMYWFIIPMMEISVTGTPEWMKK